MSNLLTRVYAKLLQEMSDLEDFSDALKNEADKAKLVTQNITIRYSLNGEDRYLNLDYGDIVKIIDDTAAKIRQDLARDGFCAEKKE